jgi:PAS domain S-box-containing protein
MNYSEWHRTLSAPIRYALATLFFLTALTVRFFLFPINVELPFIAFYPAVLITFLLCGTMPGVVSSLLSALVGIYLFAHLNYPFQSNEGVYVKLVTFLLLCVLLGAIISRMHRYATELAFQNKEKEKRADELLIANKELVFQNKEKEKRAYELLILNTEMFQSDLDFHFILENSPIAIRIASKATGLLVFVNKRYCQLAELPAQDLIGSSREQFDVTEHAYSDMPKNTINKDSVQGKLVKLTNHNKIKWALASGLEMNFEGEPVYLGWFYEITDQKMLERKLIDTQEQLNLSFEGSGDGIWDWYIATNKVTYSKNYRKLLGYDEREFTGEFNAWEEQVHPDDLPKAKSALKNYLDGVTPNYIIEHRMRCKDGSYKWILSRGVLSDDKNGNNKGRMIGTHTDITRQKETEHALLIAKYEADKANLAKSKFLAAASHDLRQPLTALSLYVDVLTKQNNVDDSGLGKKIQGCVTSLSELLDNLLNISKLDAGVVAVTKTTFSLSDVLVSLVNIHAAEAALKGLSLHLRPTNLITHTDQAILQRILGNFISNAIRYTDKGGILIGCRPHNGKQWIEVWDSGVGFPSNMAQHIFEEFTQLGDNSRRVGSGLGLAIADKSAKLLGLELRVHSRPGRGSMFAIEIPQGEVLLLKTVPESKAVFDKWNIALVDDNPMVLEATAFALKEIGHQVIAAESELDLFKNLAYEEPDILISDYRLADNKTGLDLILKARTVFGKGLPAILITGDTDPKLIKLFAKHKIKVCYKPLKIDVLNNLISEVMLTSEETQLI